MTIYLAIYGLAPGSMGSSSVGAAAFGEILFTVERFKLDSQSAVRCGAGKGVVAWEGAGSSEDKPNDNHNSILSRYYLIKLPELVDDLCQLRSLS